MEKAPQPAMPFKSPEEEIAYLREQLAAKEESMRAEHGESAAEKMPTVEREVLAEYHERPTPEVVSPERREAFPSVEEVAAETEAAPDTPEAFVHRAYTDGIKRTLEVLQETGNPHLIDEVHRLLIEEIRGGSEVTGVKEGGPLWEALHMSLFEVTLPPHEEDGAPDVQGLLSAMEKFFVGMQSLGYGGKTAHYTIEIAVAAGSNEIVFYVSVPSASSTLFEKHLLSLFPRATVTFQPHDYNVFVENGTTEIAVGELKKHPIYPLLASEEHTSDPLDVLINTFSKLDDTTSGAAVQFTFALGGGSKYLHRYESIIKDVDRGESPRTAIDKASALGSVLHSFKGAFSSSSNEEEKDPQKYADDVALFKRKISHDIVPTNIRVVSSGVTEAGARATLSDIESAFSQFSDIHSNALAFKRLRGKMRTRELRSFSFRQFSEKIALPLSHEELAPMIHFPKAGKAIAAALRQASAKHAPAPLGLPQSGTLLGVNAYRGVDTKVFVTPEDRLRHFYIIGQTGTGKTTLMKNMVVQDIQNGDGVCMIDPHGSDIADIMGSIPPERHDDVIYFDPSNLDQVMGLNMLEYDETKPEQKTFVVNELFSIFKKLYSEESMGPMFEQYFRNATLLVLEDPESGSTLLDISRVMSDPQFRAKKLAKARNPVVVQFWNEIATQAGGEASLENIVPYIVSKLDTFTANDYMRPIIGQQKSAFNFRQLMDERKILLVNLSKGRIGELNANLIGMIIVGKVLMAALSRVDDTTKGFPPFYLHMDEFQNVTTDSISAILSEARKYKLGLTIAHQFIAQIDPTIRDAVFGNVGNMAAFRVGADDADFLEKQFAPEFTAQDLLTIENRNAYLRMLVNGTPTKPFNIATMAPPPSDPQQVAQLIEYSAQRYGEPRRKVEMEIAARYAK